MNVFIIFCYSFSIINLLILTFILWLKRGKGLTNIVFGFYTFLFSIPLFFNLTIHEGLFNIRYYYLCLFPAFLVGPTVYLFCLLSTKSPFVLKKHLVIHFLPAIASACILCIFTEIIRINNLSNAYVLLKGNGIPDLFRYIVVTYGYSYHFYSLYVSRKSLKSDTNHSESFKNERYRIYDFFKTMSFICVLFTVSHLIRVLILGITPVGSSVITPILLSVSYVYILIKLVVYVPIFTGNSIEKDTELADRTDIQKNIAEFTEEQIVLIENKLIQAMEQDKLFKDQNHTLNRLSIHIDVSPKLLSQFISYRYLVNFSDYINRYRVEESIKMIQDPSMKNLKLEVIAEASGFKSRASFFAIFKKITGHTPAAFRKEFSVLIFLPFFII